ncbi:MAG: hypothetical protein AVDCRST_MAG19-3051, partial [uncultured Thermomicrobiales bacterium]
DDPRDRDAAGTGSSAVAGHPPPRPGDARPGCHGRLLSRGARDGGAARRRRWRPGPPSPSGRCRWSPTPLLGDDRGRDLRRAVGTGPVRARRAPTPGAAAPERGGAARAPHPAACGWGGGQRRRPHRPGPRGPLPRQQRHDVGGHVLGGRIV